MRYAVGDVGTNSCRLLIADVENNGMEVRVKQVVTTRIGEGLQESGWIRPRAMERTIDCLCQFNDLMRRWQVNAARIVATSAVRDAGNAEDFLALAEEKSGRQVIVLSGEAEGYLSYYGAQKGLQLAENPLVVDIGGGSVEFAFQQEKMELVSVPVGAVRASEGNWTETDILERLGQQAAGFAGNPRPLVLVGGTATSLVAIKKGLKYYDPGKVQGETISLAEMNEIYDRLAAMPLEERKTVPGLQPERADIILAGITVTKAVLKHTGHDRAIISDSDLLEGLIWSMHQETEGHHQAHP